MKIAIDTDRDSPDSIRKVIKLLHDLVNEPYTNYASSSSPGSSSDGLFTMFGSTSAPASPQPSSSQGSSPSVFDVFKDDSSPFPSVPSSAPSSSAVSSISRRDDDPDDDPDDPAPSKPPLKMKESDPRAKKFQFPDDQISIIEY